jgi:hypothetical protein
MSDWKHGREVVTVAESAPKPEPEVQVVYRYLSTDHLTIDEIAAMQGKTTTSIYVPAEQRGPDWEDPFGSDEEHGEFLAWLRRIRGHDPE